MFLARWPWRLTSPAFGWVDEKDEEENEVVVDVVEEVVDEVEVEEVEVEEEGGPILL